MTKEASEIEVEVVEVENTLPASRAEPAREAPPGGDWREWRQWQGRVRRIDTRWWPRWGIPGIIVRGLAAVAGAAIGLVVLVFVLVRALIRMLLR